MLSLRRHPAAHARPAEPSPRRQSRLITAIGVGALIIGAQYIFSLSTSSLPSEIILPAPSITLAGNGQVANRIALSLEGLQPGHEVVLPVNITNAGNQLLEGVTPALASAAPGVQLAMSAISGPVGVGQTVQYAVHLRTDAPVPDDVDQVVVAFTPSN